MAAILPLPLPADPMAWARAWFDQAAAQSVQRNPNAMTLATVGDNGQPSSRVVLCKSFIEDPGYIVFYTNYHSRKVQEIDNNANVAASMHWDQLGRQIRLEGKAVRSPADESDAYFATRHWGSQIGAWGSDQSRQLASRQALMDQIATRARSMGVQVADDLQSVPDGDRPALERPQHWGGIRLWPHTVELWIEGTDRIHDRACWSRTLQALGDHDFDAGAWSGTRLQP